MTWSLSQHEERQAEHPFEDRHRSIGRNPAIAPIRPHQFRRDDPLIGSLDTVAFVARTNVFGADAAARYSVVLEQAVAMSAI